MAKIIFPSSYECDCGYRCDFFENTVRDMKKMSQRQKKEVILGDSDDKHKIVFYKGEAVKMICRQLGECLLEE